MGLARRRLMFSPALELAFVTKRQRRSKRRSLWVIAIICSLWIVMLALHLRTWQTLPLPGAARCDLAAVSTRFVP